MAVGMHIIQGMAQFALFVDDKSGTADRRYLFSVHFLFMQHTVLPAYPPLGIREQQYRQAVLVAKGRMADAIVAADADHPCFQPGKLVFQHGEFVRLDRAARRIVLGIKVQHNVLPVQQAGQSERMHVCIGQFKMRRLDSGLERYSLSWHDFLLCRHSIQFPAG